ncbi:MAG: hypothetical protein ACTSPW_20885, partial [Promethearchaeota archaeon]
MTDVNEEIVAKYFELKGYLVRRNLYYEVNAKHSPGSDIDLIIYNPKSSDRAIVEVKGWHTEVFTLSYFKEIDRIYNFLRPEAIKKAEEFFGTNKFRKILVVSELPKMKEKQNKIKEYVK